MDYRQLLDDVFYVMLFGGVTISGIVAAFYLLFRKANAIAPEVTSPVRLRRWTAAFLLAGAFSHEWWILAVTHPLTKDPIASYAVTCCLDIITVFPTMMGTLLSMLQDRRRPLWPFCLALLPLLLLYSLFISLGNKGILTFIIVYALLLIVVFTLFMVFSVRHYGRWLQENYADLEHKEIRMSLLVLAVFLIFFAMYETVETGGRTLAYLLQADILFLTVFLVWRVETLQVMAEDTQAETEPLEDAQKASAPPVIPTNIGPLLEKHCEETQLYLQHDLTLVQLAHAI